MIDPIVQIYQLLTLALIMFASFKDNSLNPSLSCIIIKVIDTIPVINLVIDTIKCCIKLFIDTFYSPCLICILLRS